MKLVRIKCPSYMYVVVNDWKKTYCELFGMHVLSGFQTSLYPSFRIVSERWEFK